MFFEYYFVNPSQFPQPQLLDLATTNYEHAIIIMRRNHNYEHTKKKIETTNLTLNYNPKIVVNTSKNYNMPQKHQQNVNRNNKPNGSIYRHK